MFLDFDMTLLQAGGHTVSLGEAVLATVGLTVAVLIAILAALWRSSNHRAAIAEDDRKRASELEIRLAEMATRLQTIAETAASREAHMARTLNQRLDHMGHRIGQSMETNTKRTSDSLASLQERLAVIDTAQKNITELSTQVVGLQDILANKQSRGAFGQGRMEAIIMDGMAKSSFSFQATLSNGTRPDCLIHLPNMTGGIVIDAKFPLEAFNALREAGSPEDTKAWSQRLRGDVTKHIRDISEKYLIPGETQDTAIMFVPSESVYADLHELFEDLIQKAYRSRVVIVSPNMLMLAVQTMQAILKDAQMREQAGLIQAEVGKLMQDVYRTRDRVLDLQRHFGQANKDIDKILISTDKLTSRGMKIEQVELEEDQTENEYIPDAERDLLAGE